MILNRKKYFSLVEIAIAIGILAIGVTAIMSLFPVGLSRSRGAIGKNYCADAADSLFAYISRAANASTGDWAGIVSLLPREKVDIPDTGRLGSDFSFGDTANSEGDIYYDADDINTSGETVTAGDGVYGIKVLTDHVVDFTGEALLWQTDIPPAQVTGEEVSLSSDEAVGINLEISWPVEKPYSERKKNYYYFELRNSN
ncbi:MAG: hypothetical protein K9M56_06635 [Victivallales bacterium]|nr:hypothetical protein [Victivallales bacterium]